MIKPKKRMFGKASSHIRCPFCEKLIHEYGIYEIYHEIHVSIPHLCRDPDGNNIYVNDHDKWLWIDKKEIRSCRKNG